MQGKYNKREITAAKLCTTINLANAQVVHAMMNANVLHSTTFVKNFVNVHKIVITDSLGADVKHSATRNSAHVISLLESAIPIYAGVVLISLVRMHGNVVARIY